MQILVDPDAIKRRIERIYLTRVEIEKELDKIEQVVNSLGYDWQGESERVYRSKLDFIRKEYDKLIRFYDELNAILREISEKNDKIEHSVINLINNV